MAKTLVRNVTVMGANGPVTYGPAAGNQASVPNDIAAQITSATAWALTAASQAEMLALSSATVGDVCVRTDTDPDSVYILTATPPATLGNWTLLNPQSTADAVLDGVNLATQAELTAAISGLSGTFVETIALAGNPDLLIAGVITRDANDAPTSAPVVWPNGQPGTYTATAVSTEFPGAVDAYTITYGSPVTRTYTQPAVTRNANGAVTTRPAITVA